MGEVVESESAPAPVQAQAPANGMAAHQDSRERLFIRKRTSSKPRIEPGRNSVDRQALEDSPRRPTREVYRASHDEDPRRRTELSIDVPSPGLFATIAEEEGAGASTTPLGKTHLRPPEALGRRASARHRLRRLLHRNGKGHLEPALAVDASLPDASTSSAILAEPVANRMLGAAAVAPSFGDEDAPGRSGTAAAQGQTLLTTVPMSDLIDDLTPQAEAHEAGNASAAPAAASLPAVPVLVQSTADVKSVAVALQTDAIPAVQQKPNIKVRIITWNMHDSIPRGDLETLLGRVGPYYIAPEPGWDRAAGSDTESESEMPSASGSQDAQALAEKERLRVERRRKRGKAVVGQEGTSRADRIPPLPYDDQHPYHVLIVAGQECPWGDGKRLATGVGLAGELGDLSRSKTRTAKKARPKDSEGGGEPLSATTTQSGEPESARTAPMTPSISAFDFATNRSSNDLLRSAYPMTPGLDSAGGGDYLGAARNAGPTLKGWGGKGWSDVCEEYFCKGAGAGAGKRERERDDLLSPSATPSHAPSTPIMISRAASPAFDAGAASSRGSSLDVAGSPPRGKAKDGLLASGVAKLAVPTPPFLKRNRSNISLTEGALAVAQAVADTAKPSGPHAHAENGDANGAAHEPLLTPAAAAGGKRLSKHALRLDIPESANKLVPHLSAASSAEDGTPLSLGPYELVIKERMMGCYLACYVWRGCLDRVRGCSRAHVKSGLLAGRVGNKGACGISLKLGQTRLLFVNAHLAAHEGRVATRIANVEKIKSELELDTFLPESDPRNSLGDITEKFDHTFWFGDLNFRVDITRKHADWLVMHKRYDDALEFDQLRKILREGKVFRGFREAPILFPPTFKYDVIKTIKGKRGKTVRRGITPSAEGGERRSIEDVSFNTTRADLSAFSGIVDPDASSLSSISGSGPSNACPDDLADRSELPGDEEEGLFTRDDIMSPDGRARRVAREKEQKARATGLKGLLRRIVKRGEKEDTPTVPAFADPISRSLSAASSSSSLVTPASATTPGLDLATEVEGEQPYDTSAKQRVPSWCDRCLWRSNVEAVDEMTALEGIGRRMSVAFANAVQHAKAKQVLQHASDLAPLAEHQQPATAAPAVTFTMEHSAQRVAVDAQGPAKQRGLAQRMRFMGPRRANSGDHTALVQARPPRLSLDTGAASRPASASPSGLGLSDSPEASPRLLASPRRTSFAPPRRSWSHSRVQSSESIHRVGSSPSAAPVFVSTEEAVGHNSKHPRGGSDALPVAPKRKPARSLSLGGLAAEPPERRGTWWQEHISPFLPGFLGDAAVPSPTTAALENMPAAAAAGVSASAPSRKLSFGLPWLSSYGDAAATLFGGSGGGGDGFSAGPGFGSASTGSDEAHTLPQLVGPDKGHIDCLLYRALDDKEMRRLEGRSDHRPVIFVACIGI